METKQMRILYIILLSFSMVAGMAKELKMGFDSNMHPKFNDKEGRLAVNILTDEILFKWMNKIKYDSPKTYDYAYTKQLIDDFVNGKIDAGLIGVRDFYKYKDTISSHSKEILAVQFGKKRYLEIGFIVPKEKKDLPLKAWKNKRIVYNEAPVMLDFLDLYLLENTKMDTRGFFVRQKAVRTDGLAIMDVFFKKADIAISTKTAFDVSVELNPQLGKKISFVPFTKMADIAVLIFFNNSFPKTDVDFLQNSVENFLKTPRGEQISNLLTISMVAVVLQEDLDFMVSQYKKLALLKEKY